MTGRLSGRRAIITGGANGLGAATARLFAAEGAAVVLADLGRASGAAADVIADVQAAGGTAHFVEVDVRDAATTRDAVDRAAELMGGIDTVVASAGVGAPPQPKGSIRQLTDLDIDGFDFVMDVNLRGVFLTCQRAAQLMIEAGHGGAMVTLASMASKRPTAGVYSISKAAVWMMTRCLAQELGVHGIRINAIGPGYVDTELFQSMVVSVAGDDEAAREHFRESRRSQVALGRFGTPDDVARTALFLCSDEASYFTGSILHPDGGFTSTFGGG
jgi:NAD(P)-dependent dehydrogenase (short-subunit alcohol dehydrogenase family)